MSLKSNAKYWQERMERTFLEGEQDILKVASSLKKQYELAAKEIEKQINIFYGKYQTTSGLDMTTVKKQLNKSELKDFKTNLNQLIDYAKNHQFDTDFIKQKRLLNLKTKISRLEELNTNIEFEIHKLSNENAEQVRKSMYDIYDDTYMKTIYNVDTATGMATSFTMPDTKAVTKLLDKPIDINNYAVGLYKSPDKLINILETRIPQGMILGYNPQKVAKLASKALDTDYNSIVRLVRTEYNYAMNQATKNGYKECGINKYQILATLDERTCQDCGQLDLHLFEVGKEIIGVNYPPFHPNCRCTTVPYFEPDEFDKPTERIAKDKNNNPYMVDGKLTYDEWKQGLTHHKDETINYQDSETPPKLSNKQKLQQEYRDLAMQRAEQRNKLYNTPFDREQQKKEIEEYLAKETTGAGTLKKDIQQFKYSIDIDNNKVNPKKKPIRIDNFNKLESNTNFIKEVTATDKDVIHDYTYKGDKDINKYLRTPISKRTPNKELDEKINTLSNAINKYKLNNDITVYRTQQDLSGFENLKEGDVITANGFTSTSLKNVSKFGTNQIIIHVPKGANGAYVANLSEFKDEEEFLLNKGTKFKVLTYHTYTSPYRPEGIRSTFDTMMIELEVLLDE